MAETVRGSWANGGEVQPHPGRAQGVFTMPVADPEDRPRKGPKPNPGCIRRFEGCTPDQACPRHNRYPQYDGVTITARYGGGGTWSSDVYSPTVEALS